MRTRIPLACTLLSACVGASTTPGTPPDPILERANDGIAQTTLDATPPSEVQTDVITAPSGRELGVSEATGPLSDTDPDADWWPADLSEGWYTVELISVSDDGCGLELDDSYDVRLEQSADGPALWGFAPILTDGRVLSLAGQTRVSDGECSDADLRDGLGTLTGTDSFELEVHNTIHSSGDCPVTSCTTTYRASYTWTEAPDT